MSGELEQICTLLCDPCLEKCIDMLGDNSEDPTEEQLLKVTPKLIKDFGGKTPGTMEELLTLPGVGRKTANLVLILAYQSVKNICVDTHVHRIANRLGWVKTKTPDETEQALYSATEPRWWPYINLYLVTWGQNVCRPVYPRCPACAIRDLCPRIGVTIVSKTLPPPITLEV